MPRGEKVKGWPIYKDIARGQVVYRCPYRDSSGRQRTATHRDLATAKRFASDARSSNPPSRNTGTMRLSELWAYMMKTTPPREQSTRERYEQLWRLHIAPYLGTSRLREIDASDIKQGLTDLRDKQFVRGSGARTIEQARALLHHLFDTAVEDMLATTNPVTRGSRKALPERVRRVRRIVSLTELHRLAREMPTQRDQVYLYLMALGGARIGEPAALRVKDFDSGRVWIRAAVKGSGERGSTKTDRDRKLPLPKWLAVEISALARDKLPEAWLLPSPLGQMMNPKNWRRRVFHPATIRAGLQGLQPHDLRHSASSLWAELEIPDGYRSLMLGHALNRAGVSAMTTHYTHLTPGIEMSVVTALERSQPPS